MNHDDAAHSILQQDQSGMFRTGATTMARMRANYSSLIPFAVTYAGFSGLFVLMLIVGMTMNILCDGKQLMDDLGALTAVKAIPTGERRLLAEIFLLHWTLAGVGFFCAMVSFICWMYRAIVNLKSLFVDTFDTKPVWAIVSWFIPIGGLFMPYAIVQKIAQASDPKESDSSWKTAPTPWYLPLWWLMWLSAGTFCLLITQAIEKNFPDAGSLPRRCQSMVDVFWIITTFLSWAVVFGISRKQNLKRRSGSGSTFKQVSTVLASARKRPDNVLLLMLCPVPLVSLVLLASWSEVQKQEGWDLLKSGKDEAAIRRFNNQLVLDPRNANATFGRGCAYSNRESFDKAISDFDRCVALNQSVAPALRERGLVRYFQGNMQQAITDLSASLKLEPADFLTNYQLGMAYLQQKNGPAAVSYLTTAAALRPMSGDAYYNKGKAWMLCKRFDNALTDFRQAARLGDDIDAIYGAAYCLEKLGRYRAAAEKYKQACDRWRLKGNSEWSEKSAKAAREMI